jgi:hypothetical protein
MSLRPTKTSELQLTSFHEAGHAAKAHLRGLPVFRASIQPTDDSLGRVNTEGLFGEQRPICDPSDRRTAIAYIEVLLAGPIAEARRLALAEAESGVAPVMERLLRTAEGQRDMTRAADIAKSISFSPEEARHLMHHLAWRTAGRFVQVKRVWHAVETLATALVAHGDLDGSHVHWLLRASLNGRSYVALQERLAARVAKGRGSFILGLSRTASRMAV